MRLQAHINPRSANLAYLAFMFHYTKLHRMPPTEADMQRYLGVTPPSVHRMRVKLEANGFISRAPVQPRAIHLLIPEKALPKLR